MEFAESLVLSIGLAVGITLGGGYLLINGIFILANLLDKRETPTKKVS